MFQTNMFEAADPCRVVSVPVCDPPLDPSVTTPAALANFVLALRDTMDFTVDWGAWIAANGNPNMSAVSFTVVSNSPKAPTIVGQTFSPQGKSLVVLSVPPGGAVGDAYWLDVSAVFDATQPEAGGVAIPQRKATRRVYVVVVAG